MTVEERLEAMQKELDVWKRFTRWMLVPMVLVVAGAVGWGGFMKPVQAEGGKVVRAEKFVVVDQQGEMRAVLTVVDDGTPGLVMYDAQGKLRVGLAVDVDGRPALVMLDERGKRRVGLAVDVDGIPMLGMHDEQGKPRVLLGVVDDGTPGLWMYGAQGEVIWSAPR